MWWRRHCRIGVDANTSNVHPLDRCCFEETYDLSCQPSGVCVQCVPVVNSCVRDLVLRSIMGGSSSMFSLKWCVQVCVAIGSPEYTQMQPHCVLSAQCMSLTIGNSIVASKTMPILAHYCSDGAFRSSTQTASSGSGTGLAITRQGWYKMQLGATQLPPHIGHKLPMTESLNAGRWVA